MTTTVATTGSGYLGADADGLDRLGREFTTGAEIVNAVKAACEVIVAAASLFGPFGAAFVGYLKTTVIPWLTKIAEALTAMAKILSMHSAAQRSASSSATSLPSYTTPAALPSTSTTSYPTLPAAGAGPTAAAPSAGVTPVSAVTTPIGIGATSTTAPGTAAHPATGSTDPTVQGITALTGLVTAVDHLIHPTAPAGGLTTPTGTVTPTTGLPAAGLSGTATVDGLTGTLGTGGGGIDVSTLQPLHPGDSVGVLTVPVDVSPTGAVTPLIHPIGTVGATPAHIAPATVTAHLPDTPATAGGTGASGGGASGGGALGGGASGGGGAPIAPVSATPTAIHQTPAVDAVHTVAAHPGTHAAGDGTAAGPLAASGPGASHDGLYAGIGQATGIGAGGAALARATLHEVRQRAEAALAGGSPLPSDALSDGAARARVLDTELR